MTTEPPTEQKGADSMHGERVPESAPPAAASIQPGAAASGNSATSPGVKASANRRRAWWALVLLVCAAHWWLGNQVASYMFWAGRSEPPPKAFDVSFEREMELSEPPAAEPPPPAPTSAATAEAAASQALEPSIAASAVQLPEQAAGQVAEQTGESLPASPAQPQPELAVQAQAAASAALAASDASPAIAQSPAASASIATMTSGQGLASGESPTPERLARSDEPDSFSMLPPSTRLDYKLTGWFRGELHGLARVDWLRKADRYQVRLSVKVPGMVERRMISEGYLTENGLSPSRYDQETDVLFSSTRRETMRFSEDSVQLGNGRSEARPPAVQDTASQFVQMSWRFMTRRTSMRVGQAVTMPLALPRRVGVWTYDIAAEVNLPFPFEPALKTFHLKPRPDASRPGELSVEMWLAPALQFLPVRIIIRLDAQNYMQLDLLNRPLQAE